MEKQVCDQCENQCSIDELKCGKGRKHFGLEPDEGGKGHPMPEGPLGLLMQCGHVLHHGGASGEGLLRALSAEEQTELERLLGLLLEDWKTRMPGKGHGQPGK
ncbi:MAG: hypothetical protein Q4F81_09690 [Eubacteriales bacterium]|nr:hypothetical protein [Eubacteriales bacterium]